MPKIKIDHVVSFSSEDPVHVANNILSSDNNKKWKCRTAGEISANVVLQLEKASNITSIDIGNENSAYIEVLVARSGSDEDYKPLLVMSSFMTPLESRQTTNVNKVRMFTYDELSDPEKKEKWDRVKIVCTQPFNRHVQYGLCFVNFHCTEGKGVDNKAGNMIGRFTLRPESPEALSTGSLFARRKEIQKEQKDEQLKGAAAIREASTTETLQQRGTPVSKKKIKITPSQGQSSLNDDEEKVPKERNRNELLYSKDEEDSNVKIDKIIEKKAQETQAKKQRELLEKKEKEKKKDKDKRETPKKDTPKQDRKKDSDKKQNSASKKKDSEPSSSKDTKQKRKIEDDNTKPVKKKKLSVQTKPFSKLLDGVVVVISGIQNPDRANLRTSALLLGAKYKPNWDNTCTHLICAFQNTPKFNEVKGKGKIVTKKWIEDCYEERKRFPWRRYALDKNDKSQVESEDEIWEKTGNTPPSSPVPGSSNQPETSNGNRGSDTEDEIEAIRNQSETPNKSDSDDDIQIVNNPRKPTISIDDSDTEDEIKKINGHQKVETDIYNCDTEPEDIPKIKKQKDIPDKFKDFFDKKRFFVDSSFSKEKLYLLKRHIVAYNGVFVDDPTDNIDIVITTKENFENIRDMHEDAICLLPNWIAECHKKQELVPMDDYILH